MRSRKKGATLLCLPVRRYLDIVNDNNLEINSTITFSNFISSLNRD